MCLSNQCLSNSLESEGQTLDQTYFEQVGEKLEQTLKEPSTSLTRKTRRGLVKSQVIDYDKDKNNLCIFYFTQWPYVSIQKFRRYELNHKKNVSLKHELGNIAPLDWLFLYNLNIRKFLIFQNMCPFPISY